MYDLKLNIQKTKIMASGPITSWQIDAETVETVADLILVCHVTLLSFNLKLFLSFFSFIVLPFLKSSGQLFCRMSLSFGLSDASQ